MKTFSHGEHRGDLSIKQRKTKLPFADVTEKIIACAIDVHSSLGPGLLEKLYEEALAHEFLIRGIEFERQREIRQGDWIAPL